MRPATEEQTPKPGTHASSTIRPMAGAPLADARGHERGTPEPMQRAAGQRKTQGKDEHEGSPWPPP